MFFLAYFLATLVTTSDASLESLSDRLKALSEINSGSFNEEGLENVALALQKEFAPVGLDLEWDAETRSLRGQSSVSSPKAKVLLIGHLDTVFEPFHPFQKAIRDGDRLKGPGVADAKGGLLLMREVLASMGPWAETHKIQWIVFISGDEEIGSKYSKDSLIDVAKTADIALVFEPGWFDDGIKAPRVPASLGGNLQLSLRISSPESHTGTSNRRGRGALDIVSTVIQDLGALRSASRSINFYEIDYKSKSNVAGGMAELKVSIRYEKNAERIQVIEKLKLIQKDLAKKALGKLDWEDKDVWTPQALSDPALLRLWTEAHRDLKTKSPLPSLSLARSASSFLSAAGIPVLDSMGPYGSHLHSDKEEVRLESFSLRLQLIQKFLNRWIET